MAKVAIVMGSKSDYEIVKTARDTLEQFGVETECRIISAHRTPDIAHDFAKNAIKNGFSVIIAAAGKAAHLAGVLASFTTLPVIGIPVKSSTMDGMDSLLSTVQMPAGIPVATVAINGSQNAALLAVQILALGDKKLCEKFAEYKKQMANKIEEEDKKFQTEIK